MVMIIITMMMIIMMIMMTNDDDCSEELRRGREEAVRRIEGYHRHIDNCTAEMSKFFLDNIYKYFFTIINHKELPLSGVFKAFLLNEISCLPKQTIILNFLSEEHERKIDECRERIKRQQDMIRF